MKSALIAWGIGFGFAWMGAAAADEHRVEVLAEAPPADEIGSEIVTELSDSGLRVLRGEDKKICDIWLRESWPLREDFTPSLAELYPFEVGELIGVVRYHGDGEDFRAQEIPAGVYTLRFALQPVDGNHVGTSETRDFLLLISAADDQELANLEESQLWSASAEAVGTSHPAMLSLQYAGDVEDDLPAISHNEEFDQWSIAFRGQPEGKDRELVVRMVVVGHAAE